MRRIFEVLTAARDAGRLAFIPHLTAGDPDRETTDQLVGALVAEGADIVGLGVPFSDPLAAGVTSQRAAERALGRGMTLAGVLDLVQDLRESSPAPLVLSSYFNPILRMGVEEFARRASRAGVDGVLVTDLPPDEGEIYRRTLAASGIDPIFMLSPTSGPERLRLVAQHTGGFIYYASRAGVTGARDELPPGLREEVARVRLTSGLPVVVGCGVSRPEHLATLGGAADGVLVGSAIAERLEAAGDRAAAVESVRHVVRRLLQKQRR